jgi:hypothetical protein
MTLRAFAEGLQPGRRVVALPAPFDRQRLTRDLAPQRNRQRVALKPRGFWYACGGEWLLFSEGMLGLDAGQPFWVYELSLDLSRVLRVGSPRGLRALSRRYGRNLDDDDPTPTFLDWRAVARDYDGIEVCPSQRKGVAGWYDAWDVASGCVWQPRAVRSARLLRVDRVTAAPSTRTRS